MSAKKTRGDGLDRAQSNTEWKDSSRRIGLPKKRDHHLKCGGKRTPEQSRQVVVNSDENNDHCPST